MRVIAIVNQKGGCGKTTTSVNLAAALAHRGKRVLVVDLDPQGHSTLAFAVDLSGVEKTIYNAITDLSIPISSVIVGSNTERLDVTPSNVLLSGAELDLASVTGREFMLSEQLKTLEGKYDFCVIDCPPSLGILTLNALVASTDVIVPVQVHYYAMEGLKQLFETCEIVEEHFYPCSVRILGLLLTFVEDRLIFSRQIQQQMREFFGDLVFDTVIHRNIRLAEAPSAGESVLSYAPDSRGAAEYLALADEIISGKKKTQTETGSEVVQVQTDGVEIPEAQGAAVSCDQSAPTESMNAEETIVSETQIHPDQQQDNPDAACTENANAAGAQYGDTHTEHNEVQETSDYPTQSHQRDDDAACERNGEPDSLVPAEPCTEDLQQSAIADEAADEQACDGEVMHRQDGNNDSVDEVEDSEVTGEQVSNCPALAEDSAGSEGSAEEVSNG